MQFLYLMISIFLMVGNTQKELKNRYEQQRYQAASYKINPESTVNSIKIFKQYGESDDLNKQVARVSLEGLLQSAYHAKPGLCFSSFNSEEVTAEALQLFQKGQYRASLAIYKKRG